MDRDEAVRLLREGRVNSWNQLLSERAEIPSLEDVDLSGADLSGADLSDADLSGANLRGADLRWALLQEADLSRADLRGAKLSRAEFFGAYLPRIHRGGVRLRGANLSGANLSGANLSNADLRGADLSNADLRGVNLSWSDLSWSDLRKAWLYGSRLDVGQIVFRFFLAWFRGIIRGIRDFFFPLALLKLEIPSLENEVQVRLDSRPPGEPSLPADNRPARLLKTLARRASLYLSRFIIRNPRRADPVDCTVFAPPAVAQGDWLFVQVFAHRPDQAEEARSLALEFDQRARMRGFKSLEIGIERGSRLTFQIHVPGIKFEAATESLVWRGRPSYVQFAAQAPSELPVGVVIGRITASLAGIPIGSIMFTLEIVEKNGTSRAPNSLLADTRASREFSLLPVGDRIRRYKKAFISYASKDRPEVLKRVQMLRLARIRYFQDVLKLEPGDRWERKLYYHIDRSDLFLLFWSTNAKESKWVLEEVRYAIKRKGGNDLAPPDVIPVIIEGPPVPLPPEDLAYLHFNDYLLYFMVPPEAKHQEKKP